MLNVLKNLQVSLYRETPSIEKRKVKKLIKSSASRVENLFRNLYGEKINIYEKVKRYVIRSIPKIKVYIIDVWKFLTGKFRSIRELIREYSFKPYLGRYDAVSEEIEIDVEAVNKDPSIIDHEHIHKAQDEILKKSGYSLLKILRKYGGIGRAYVEGWAEYLREKISGMVSPAYKVFKDAYEKLISIYGNEKRVIEDLDNSIRVFARIACEDYFSKLY